MDGGLLAASQRERDVAAGVLWAVRGDAGQRALVAWHMGWGPAQEASGTDWLPLYLALLLDDPYPAVRRSLDALSPSRSSSIPSRMDIISPP